MIFRYLIQSHLKHPQLDFHSKKIDFHWFPSSSQYEMPRFLRLRNVMVHVPSLSSVSIQTNCLGRPSLWLYYHNSKVNTKISYSKWDLCESDFNKVKAALVEVEGLLAQIPLTEEPSKPLSPVVPSTVTVEEKASS